MIKSAYIHIPFCRQKCHYCSFVSFPQTDLKKQYVETLKREIKHFYSNDLLNTLYFGGGTPSLMEPDEIQQIISLFNINSTTEITFELNPEQVSYKYLVSLKNIGINRLSFGCQTFDNQILKLIGRKHSATNVIEAISTAQQVGYDNMSLDFIYCLPSQTIKGFENDLKQATALNIQHISLYGLKIDNDCYFAIHKPANLPDDDMQACMYEKAIEILTNSGFEHYEISNFSKSGYYSRHNLNYWNNEQYYGFGLAAHGYTEGVRYENTTDFKKYFSNPTTHAKIHKVTTDESLEEEIFLGFRRMQGINVKKINQKFNIDFENMFSTALTKYQQSGHLEYSNGNYHLTTKGILVSNIILADFLIK